MVHKVATVGFVGFLVFRGVQGLTGSNGSVKRKEQNIIRFLLSQVEAASLLSIVDVNGDKAAPIYKFLKSSKGGLVSLIALFPLELKPLL
ncbi:unnamed protein product [Arabis nemorensis]|uniref:Uncharacterized protein n=1 Tax=Arabis nemorensis TaxID=586526 RepID=A0A565AT99_9BRAS|nr:unnamed protein product [Arabis nemorensis]